MDGKKQWVKVDLEQLVDDDSKAPKKPAVDPKQPVIAPENLPQGGLRDRQAVEEQKSPRRSRDAIRQANRDLKADPDALWTR